MRERADRFGGKLEFWSEAAAGAEGVLTVPARVAFAKSSAASGWWARIWAVKQCGSKARRTVVASNLWVGGTTQLPRWRDGSFES